MENKKYIIAMLILAFVVLILSYFFMFNSGKYVTGQAIINPPFSINFWYITPSEVALQIQSNENSKIQNISVENCGAYKTPTTVEPGIKSTFIISCDNLLKVGDSFKGEIVITYRKNNVDFISKGEIAGKVREK